MLAKRFYPESKDCVSVVGAGVIGGFSHWNYKVGKYNVVSGTFGDISIDETRKYNNWGINVLSGRVNLYFHDDNVLIARILTDDVYAGFSPSTATLRPVGEQIRISYANTSQPWYLYY